MKIIIITLIPSPHLYEIHSKLAEHPDVSLEIFYELRKSPKRDWGEYIPNCKHTVLNSRRLMGLSSLIDFGFSRILKQTDADMVVIGSSPWSPNTWIIKRWAEKNSIPYVVFSEPPNQNRSMLNKVIKNIMVKKFLKNSAGYAGVTKQTCETIVKLYDFHKPIFVLPYFSDLKNFISVPLRSSKNKVTKFLFLGELTERKRVDLPIQAFKRISKPFEFHIVGDGHLREELEDSALNVNSGEIVFHGKVAYQNVHNMLTNTDFLILPSNHDGFGMVVVEALAAGVPVIASDHVMSAVEYIKNGKNGWLFQSANVIELEKVLNLAIDTETSWASLAVNARESLKEYDAKILADKFYLFLKGLI